MSEIECGDIVSFVSDECECIGRYYGVTKHPSTGEEFKLFSPYSDGRPKHWLNMAVELKLICKRETFRVRMADKFWGFIIVLEDSWKYIKLTRFRFIQWKHLRQFKESPPLVHNRCVWE